MGEPEGAQVARALERCHHHSYKGGVYASMFSVNTGGVYTRLFSMNSGGVRRDVLTRTPSLTTSYCEIHQALACHGPLSLHGWSSLVPIHVFHYFSKIRWIGISQAKTPVRLRRCVSSSVQPVKKSVWLLRITYIGRIGISQPNNSQG